MGHVDTVLRYRGFNSYHHLAGEKKWSDKFDVSLYSDVVLQLVAITSSATMQTPGVGVWFYDEDNKRIQYKGNTMYVTTRWSEHWKTYTVPENAKTAQIQIAHAANGQPFNWAVAKLGPGTMPTAFTFDLMERVLYMDADGLYTSFIKANQVQTGIMFSNDQQAGFDLDGRRIFLTGDDGTLVSLTPDNPIRVESENGDLLGGLAVVDGKLRFIASTITNAETAKVWLDVGEVETEMTTEENGLRLYLGDVGAYDKPMFSVSPWRHNVSESYPTPEVTIRSVYIQAVDEAYSVYAYYNPILKRRNVMSTLGGAFIWSRRSEIDMPNFYNLNLSGAKEGETDNHGRYDARHDMDVDVNSANNKLGIYKGNDTSKTQEIGVDQEGPYYIKNGNKTYF